MRLQSLFPQLLLELDWYDISPMATVLRRNAGRYVHFTRGIPSRRPAPQHMAPRPDKPAYWSKKGERDFNRRSARADRKDATAPQPVLKVNPKPSHQDPRGIYFYPVNWMLSGTERLRQGQQYGADMAYYYVADLDTRSGINLQWVNWKEVEAIAERNGWAEPLREFRAKDPAQQKAALSSYADPTKPGSVLWHFVETLHKAGTLSWNRAFAGVTCLVDPGLAIIHSNEPNQVLVLDPRIVKVVEQGENKSYRNVDRDKDYYWPHAFAGLVKRARGEFGGQLAWKDKVPTLTWSQGWVNAVLTPSVSRSYGPSLSLAYTFGRAEGSLTFKQAELEALPEEEIVARIGREVAIAARRKTDLLFTPAITEAQAKTLLATRLGKPGSYEWTTTIYNGDRSARDAASHFRTAQMTVSGVATREADGVAIRTRVTATVSPKGVEFACGVRPQRSKGDRIAEYTSSFEGHDTPEAGLAALAGKVADAVNRLFDNHLAPSKPGAYRNWRDRRFRSAEDCEAAKGWFALHCGLGFDGGLEQAFAPAISAYEALGQRDRKDLHGEIGYVLAQFDDRD